MAFVMNKFINPELFLNYMAKEYLAEFGSNEEEARNKLMAILPHPEGREHYKRFKITVQPMADDRYLAKLEYELKPESRQQVVRPATGAVSGELERMVEKRNKEL